METILSVQNLSKNYGSLRAVNKLSLSIPPGSIYGLLGPNGSGKTTTLGMLLGCIHPSEGDFQWFGQANSATVRQQIGAILEQPIFYPYLHAEANLKIVADIKQAPHSQIAEVLQKVDLYDRRKDAFKTYSLGMKQRLAIASALIGKPKVLILDEPTNGLDPQGIADIRALIIQIAKEGITIILASHLLDEVEKVCSHVIILQKGKAIYDGEVANMLHSATTVIQIASDDVAALTSCFQDYEGLNTLEQKGDYLYLSFDEEVIPSSINQFAFDKGIVLTHLEQEHKTLESQFLQLLSNKNSY